MKRIAVINDLSGLGKCSLTAALPVISVMGVQACPIPTAVLTNQTDYDSYYSVDFTDKIDYFTEEWKKREVTFDGIYTGYLGSETQVQKILHFCENFRTENTLLFVDPVMGDRGEVYDVYTPEYGVQMRRLVAAADVITPNLTECCLLTDCDYNELISHQQDEDYLLRIEQMARPLLEYGIQTIIVTGIEYQGTLDRHPCFYNLVISKDRCHYASCKIRGESYSGTGDLLASVVSAGMVRGESAENATDLAVRFLEAALKDTVAQKIPRNDGVLFESHLHKLLTKTGA